MRVLENKVSVGKLIKENRDRLRLTQQELADKSGLSKGTIVNYETGKRSPTMENLAKIALVLDVSASDLIGETDDPTPSSHTDTPVFSVGVPPIWIEVVEAQVCAGDGNGYHEVSWKPVDRRSFSTSDFIGYSWHSGTLRIIRVNGRSMKPKYHDGDKVLFSEDAVKSGDIGIVLWDGKLVIRGYVEEKGMIHLKALNPENPDIVVDPDDRRLQILGKVVAKIPELEVERGFW